MKVFIEGVLNDLIEACGGKEDKRIEQLVRDCFVAGIASVCHEISYGVSQSGVVELLNIAHDLRTPK